MNPLVLYCKSYSTDLRRLVRLARSIQQHNVERIPFYVSVPRNELALFQEHLTGLDAQILPDEDILQASTPGLLQQVERMPGYLSQQVVKSEFWRLGLAEACLCLDSDAFFIRPFSSADFLAPDGSPYTIIDEGHDILEEAIRQRKPRVLESFKADGQHLQGLLGREGRLYSFGPMPLVWHRKVWESLYTHHLTPRGMSFADAITQAPTEIRWYGEALLAYQAIPLHPCQSFFKVYHYAWQFDQDRRKGITNEDLAALYCGVIHQSAWERDMDWPAEGGHLGSKISRRLRRLLGRI